MCAPRVTRHISIRYSGSCHTRVNMGASIFFTAGGRNVNYDEKQLTGKKYLSCSFYLYGFRKYVSYGFPTINFCIPVVHYETPCILIALIIGTECVPLKKELNFYIKFRWISFFNILNWHHFLDILLTGPTSNFCLPYSYRLILCF
jgi:hypothetical protein